MDATTQRAEAVLLRYVRSPGELETATAIDVGRSAAAVALVGWDGDDFVLLTAVFGARAGGVEWELEASSWRPTALVGGFVSQAAGSSDRPRLLSELSSSSHRVRIYGTAAGAERVELDGGRVVRSSRLGFAVVVLEGDHE